MARKPRSTGRSVKITHRRGVDKGRVAVEFEMTEKDWAWFGELQDRWMIPDHDLLYQAFFQGLEKQGWKNPDDVTTPAKPPPRTNWGRGEGESDNVVQLHTKAQQSDYQDLDDDTPF